MEKELFLRLTQYHTELGPTELGHQELADPGVPGTQPKHAKPSQIEIESAVRTLIRAAGDNPEREGLVDTPARVARAYGEWFSGYTIDPAALLSRTFSEAASYQETVQLCDIPLIST